MTAAKKRPGCLAKLLLLSGSLVVALLLGELVLAPLVFRLQGKPDRALYLMGLYATPNSQLDDTPINAQGFTGDLLEREKPSADTVRMLTLGGSAMFNRRMSERIGERLAKLTPADVEIQGGALRSHHTRSSLIKYQLHFTKYHFDYVLIYHGINDLSMNHVIPDRFERDYSHSRPWNKRNALLSHSILARTIYNDHYWKPAPRKNNGVSFGANETFEHNLRELVSLIRRDGGAPILMTFAWHIPEAYTPEAFKAGEAGYNNPEEYDRCPVEMWGLPDYVEEGLRGHNEIIRTIAKEEDVLLIDVAGNRDFMGDVMNFGDVCHFSEEGTEAFIELIADFFNSQGLLATSAPAE